MKKISIIFVTLLCCLWLLPHGNLYAASIEEIKVQVSSYMSSGEISDVNFGNALHNILNDAKMARDSGDDEGKTAHLNAFSTAIDGGSGILFSLDVATTLIGMVP